MVYNILNVKELKWNFTDYEQLISFYKYVPCELYKEKNIYTERHHILPRCLGGNDLKDNLITLPWMVHALAHFLLAKKLDEEKNGQLAIKNYYAVRMILNQDKLEKEAEVVKKLIELKSIELETKNKLNCKRIYIKKDGEKTIQIFEDDLPFYEKEGWTKGRSFNNGKGKVWINNGEKSTYIPREDLEKYLADGWKKGMYRTANMKAYDRGKSLPKTKGFRWIHNGTKRLLVDPKDLEKYLKEGWSLGSNLRPVKGKRRFNNGKVNVFTKECPEGFKEGWVI